jgi:hypothetical protein
MAASVVVALAVTPVAGEFFISLAREHGLYDHPSEKVVEAVTVLSAIVYSTWFHWIGGAVFGFSAGVWIDTVLKQTRACRQLSQMTLAAR